MRTSVAILPARLTEIDALTRQDHSYLTEDDTCYYLGEYTARKDFGYSATNNLISNFKKGMDRRGKAEWKYKDQALADIAKAFRVALDDSALSRFTFVPVPPSKSKTDEMYDDRVTRMLWKIRPVPPLDVRELIVQTESSIASHESEVRPSPNDIEELYEIDDSLSSNPIESIAVVDDMLTTGAHFRAAKHVLSIAFPDASVIGLFVTRRVPDTAELDDLLGLLGSP